MLTLVNLYKFLFVAGNIIKYWWWAPLPLLLWKRLFEGYMFWNIMRWQAEQKRIVLEVKVPKEVQKPIRAMEMVFFNMHGACSQPPDNWEYYVDGQVQLSVSFEIVSDGGEVHLYIRTPAGYRDSVESSIYSQYPEAEITEVPDYVKSVPQTIPDKDWDMWGTCYRMPRDDHYPIKTYIDFETEREAEERQKIDPVSTLFEAMSKVKPGEVFWIQISADPVYMLDPFPGDPPVNNVRKWLADGEKLRDKLVRRQAAPEAQSFWQALSSSLLQQKPPVMELKVEKEEGIPPEMKLTPGEREIVAGIERKMSKPLWDTKIRFIFMGRKDVFFKTNFRLGFSFFDSFSNVSSNQLLPWTKSLTKVKRSFFLPINLVRKRRVYKKARRLFRTTVNRVHFLFPNGDPEAENFKLNCEELATIFHFPSEETAPAPGIKRVEVVKGSAPPGIPTE